MTTAVGHIIDLDADPFVPSHWSVVSHQPGGKFTWGLGMVDLYLSPHQIHPEAYSGSQLHQELLRQQPRLLNANVLDYLFAHPELIPETWKGDQHGKCICFWGTVYRLPSGELCVRYLDWLHDRWLKGYRCFEEFFDTRHPVAVRID